MMRAVESAPEAGARRDSGAWSLTGVITRLRRVLRSSVRQEFPWEALPMAQVEVLQRLAEEPGIGVSGLASRQRLAVNTVSSLVQQMVVSGLVERLTRPGDRRSVTLNLTERGATVLAAWQDANDRRLGDALRRLPQSSQQAIEDALPALAALASLLEADDRAPEGGGLTSRDPEP